LKWTKRFRKTRRADDDTRERVSRLGLLGMILLLVGAGLVFAYPYLKKPPLIERDFVGRVVEKFLATGETYRGTVGGLRLLVEDQHGMRFRVAVSDEQYEQAQVGMWVTRRAGVVALSWDEPRPGTPGADGDRIEAR
jgi:hypothetical protein